ncbi:hypothetical protein PENTCL1PPCAC_8851 [Pristionchus entomophagus]|uniref:Protein kinase domain-containing protein n=1 Tax=Pristionchus entomophagus TaxID=358040 RepID=A0AAV5T4T3_9BILA|nr:hypothetical protein PENTCL1PPCAC_8851 [Pristionchus entomophagus]
MELMDASLEEVKTVIHNQNGINLGRKFEVSEIEKFLGCVAVSVVDGLAFLWDKQPNTNRNIKPSNILINDSGQIKISDCGILESLLLKEGDFFTYHAVRLSASVNHRFQPGNLKIFDANRVFGVSRSLCGNSRQEKSRTRAATFFTHFARSSTKLLPALLPTLGSAKVIR